MIAEWGAIMRLARRASFLATEDARQKGLIRDPEQSAIMLYTDCPTTGTWFNAKRGETARICKASQIEGVAIVMGENFPPESFEAERSDLELPRVAAMFFYPTGSYCPRCRTWNVVDGHEMCRRCEQMIFA
jgi:hypothetical protein